MSLLDNASLLLTPNAYKEGKLYSVIPSNGNGDFTATRATTATRVNSAGLVDLLPYNLVQYSDMFSNAAWTKLNSSTITANTTTAPDGTMTADTYQASNLAFGGILRQTLSVASGIAYTFSFFAKKDNYRYVGIRINTSVNLQRFPNYDFDTDTLNTQGVAGANLSRELLPNGWVKLILTFTTTTTAGNPDIALTTANGDTSTALSGGQRVFVWGAQLVEGTSARDYLRTETRLNIPRIDYSLGGCPNILLEPQRTNLALQSSSFDNASWSKSASSVTANSTTSPSGITDADTYSGDGTLNVHTLFQGFTVTNGVNYSWSFYAKKNTNNFIQLNGSAAGFGVNVWANFDLNNGVVGSVGLSTTASIQNVGNGWYRCTIVGAAIASTSTNINLLLVSSATSLRGESNTLSTSVFLWGAQLEAGAYATSYIPTTTASVTRNADSITRSNIFTNGLITAAGGTWFVELRNNRVLARENSNRFGIADTSALATEALTLGSGSSAARLQIQKRIAGTLTTLYVTTTDTCKIAIKWNGTTADVFENGVKVVAATAFTSTALDFFGTSSSGIQVATFINEMALFPTPLTDAQCLALTA